MRRFLRLAAFSLGGLAAAMSLGATPGGTTATFLIIQTGCWTATSDQAFVPAKDTYVGDPHVDMQGILNFLLRREHGAPKGQSFQLIGAPDWDFETILANIHDGLAIPGVRAIIYTTAPGTLESFTNLRANARTPQILDAIEREYPSAAPFADIYRRNLVRSRGFQQAVAAHVPATTQNSTAEPLGTLWMAEQGQKLHLYDRLRFWIGRNEADEGTLNALEKCAATYDHPLTRTRLVRHFMPADKYWRASGGDENWQAWLRMVVEMCRSRGVRFVFYVPPHLNLTASEYAKAFKPHFVNRVQAVLAEFPNTTLIDHSMRRDGLAPAQLTWFRNDRNIDIKPGYLFNAIGTLKRCRFLLDDLANIESLGIPPRTGSVAWPGEARLPATDPRVKYFPDNMREDAQEIILRPAYYEKSFPVERETL